ncbi:hypothetical protein D9615_008157 [Tricholomella constricta]|uniref:F-box domain-containing protein n=1 Tax=Tricholomella constricta TaxID=117010 RepID=A0A8H5H3I1_9AGAR|nr:hypothetical protein D9615_008157 [Tricholomella constricta]
MLESFNTVEELADAFRQLSLDDWSLQDLDPLYFGPNHPLTSPFLHKTPPSPTSLPGSSDVDSIPPPAGKALERMPDDIIYQLFNFLQTADPLESLRTTVTLSHVCAQWRAVAINAPLLWTYVKLSWTRKRINHSQVVEKFLSRSQHLPLTIHLVLDLFLERYVYQWAHALSAHAHRFHELIMIVNSGLPLRVAMQVILPLEMPRLIHFDFAMLGNTGCTVAMKPRPAEQATRLGDHLVIPKSPVSYLDWTVRNFHITSLSLKYLDLGMSELFPILIMTQSTLTHLEYYNVTADDNIFPRITLPKLTSLQIGYTWARSAWSLVEWLICPNLRSVYVHDFGRCPEARTPLDVRDDTAEWPDWAANKDARELLIALCPFTQITSLTLRGVTCFFSTFEEVTLPLQHLFRGLESLVLVQSDSQFFHALFDITLDSIPADLGALSELVITSDDYPLVLDYLRLRAARGLPKLTLFSVNPRMAILRHFYRDFSNDFHVRGQVKHQPRKETRSMGVHPYPREARPARSIIGTFKFVYDGTRVQPDDTPGGLGMEDGDQIDAFLEQLGGGGGGGPRPNQN